MDGDGPGHELFSRRRLQPNLGHKGPTYQAGWLSASILSTFSVSLYKEYKETDKCVISGCVLKRHVKHHLDPSRRLLLTDVFIPR